MTRCLASCSSVWWGPLSQTGRCTRPPRFTQSGCTKCSLRQSVSESCPVLLQSAGPYIVCACMFLRSAFYFIQKSYKGNTVSVPSRQPPPVPTAPVTMVHLLQLKNQHRYTGLNDLLGFPQGSHQYPFFVPGPSLGPHAAGRMCGFRPLNTTVS